MFLIDYHFSRNDYLRDYVMDIILNKVFFLLKNWKRRRERESEREREREREREKEIYNVNVKCKNNK